MAYRLIPTGDEDQQRVLHDVACSREHHGTVAFACRTGEFPGHWAVDADTGNYLVRLAHEEIRPEFENYSERYAFCLEGALFDVRFDNMFGSEMSIKPLCGAVIGDGAVFREHLARAFAVHGRHGNPACPEAVVPEIRD
jgi:hypothetical protein